MSLDSATELSATPPDQSKLTTLRKELYESIGALKVAPDPIFIEQRTQRKRRKLEKEQESERLELGSVSLGARCAGRIIM